MAKYKSYNYSRTVMLPVSLEDQLMSSTIEFAIHTLVESEMDMSRFDDRYKNDETGCKAYDPKVLLKRLSKNLFRRVLPTLLIRFFEIQQRFSLFFQFHFFLEGSTSVLYISLFIRPHTQVQSSLSFLCYVLYSRVPTGCLP
jgi:hypothetical protein